jgi:hypothetical protein
MDFFTIWLISFLVSFIASRFAVKKALKEDKRFFDNVAGMMVAMFVLPFIPLMNIVYLLVLAIFSLIVYVDKVGVSGFARKIFFIRTKENDNEKAKKVNKKNN